MDISDVMLLLLYLASVLLNDMGEDSSSSSLVAHRGSNDPMRRVCTDDDSVRNIVDGDGGCLIWMRDLDMKQRQPTMITTI